MVEKRSLKFANLKNRKIHLLIAIIILLSSSLTVASPGDTSPIANCGPDKLKCENVNTPVQFNASASYDLYGPIVSYEWDFGDGTTGTGVAPNHTYTSYRWNGSSYLPFIVHLKVTNDSGATNITSRQVTIWIAGDANGDGAVNILDASVVGLNWSGDDACADLDNDGSVNILDASIIGLNWMQKTSDNTPPAGVTFLAAVSFAENYINWTWTDPADTDFANVSVWIDGEFKSSVPKGQQFYEATGFTADSEHNISTKTRDNSGNVNQTWVNHTARTSAAIELPPDPATVAPPLDLSVATNIATATEFLYTGSNPIQTGVAPGTIEARRAVVLRGRVLDRDGNNLTGVNISILSHPEFGSTMSRADGMFDMAVNGGGLLTVNYEKAGYLTAQRQVQTPWQDYVWLPDVVLIQVDTNVTTIDLSSTIPIQAAQGSQVNDTEGLRKATLLFPQGVHANMTLPDGSTQALTTLHVRATEYTIGTNGPEAMPAQLPPQSGYTYAVEFSVDEAAGAPVKFDQPIINYVENFLNFTAGTIVPVGYYNRSLGQWIPSDNGRVIKIISIDNNLAQIDINGSGIPANTSALAALGVTDAELQQLAILYTSNQSLWRVPVTHFSSWDSNWAFGPPPDASFPNQGPPKRDNPPPDPCTDPTGSSIECQSQILGERIDITGTPFSLHYQSDRVDGRKAAYTLDIPLSGASVPNSLIGIVLDINVAGRKYSHMIGDIEGSSYSVGTFIIILGGQKFLHRPPCQRNPQTILTNQSYSFTWDGMDVYGRTLQGKQPAEIRIGYVYCGVYQKTNRFGYNGDGQITGSRSREEVTLWKAYNTEIGTFEAKNHGLGGWDIDVHNTYDPLGRIIYLGNGERHTIEKLIGSIIETVAGNGIDGYSGDGGRANLAKLSFPVGIAISSDGSLYIVDRNNNRIRRVGPDGNITTVAGNGIYGYSGDGGPAILAKLSRPEGIAISSDGSFYIADTDNHRIRRVGIDGNITTVAGIGSGYSGDGGPATLAKLSFPHDVAIGSDGSLYIADWRNMRIRRVSTDGNITTVAGCGFCGSVGEGIPATQVYINYPEKISVDQDGRLYISTDCRIRHVGTDGNITTVAGNDYCGYSGDGSRATLARLYYPRKVAIGSDGSLYIDDNGNNRIRRIDIEGIITTVAGNGISGYSGDGGPATLAKLTGGGGVAIGLDGSFYLGDTGNNRIRRAASPLPGYSASDVFISSEDGNELYAFSSDGRHMRTFDTFTGAVRYNFTYDGSGRLTAITDIDGNVMTIERDVSGNPTAIIAPYGQRTSLTLDSNGYLASVTNPAGESAQLGYTADGLLTSMTNPRGNTYRFSYDAKGRLIKDEDPAGGSKSLSRNDTANGYSVNLTTGMNHNTTYKVEQLSTGDQKQVNTFSNGLKTETLIGKNGSETITYPDGTIITQVSGPDPRFGMQAPVLSSMTVKTPGGLSQITTNQRTATLANPNDPLSLKSLNDTSSINGRTYTSIFNATWKNITTNTPSGRKTFTTIDSKGRIVDRKIPGIVSVNYTYDARGRLGTTTQGTRSYAFSYDAQGNLENITDPLSRTAGFEYDTAGRVTKQNLPDGRQIQYTYDTNGNIFSISPPGRPNHDFNYTPVDLIEDYIPPDLGLGPVQTHYTYNIDRQLTMVTRPDGAAVDLGYDSAGRLSTITYPQGTTRMAYDPLIGNLKNITAPDGGKITYAYDGNLLTDTNWSGAISGSIHRSYDNNFSIISESINGANTVNFKYDMDGLLTRVGLLNLSRAPQNGLLNGTSLENVNDMLSYNSFGEVAAYQAASSGTNLFSVNYTRDDLGRIIEKNEMIDGSTHIYDYMYDQAGRLANVSEDGVMVSQYVYDANGNRRSYTGTSGTITGTYDNQDRLLQYGTTTYNYNANGDLISKTNESQTTTYQYDVLGNLRNVTLPDSTQIEYIIDGRDRRVGKKVNGVLIQSFLYKNQLNPIAELDVSGKVVSRFIYASRNNVPDYMIKGGNSYRIISDQLGSPRLVVNTITGEISQRIEYDEFGNVIQDTNPGFQPFGFAAGLYDHQIKLLRFGARDYDPETGRWTTKDPLGFFGGLNFYEYAYGDPINLMDFNGMKVVPLNQCQKGDLSDVWDEVKSELKEKDPQKAKLMEDLEKDPNNVLRLLNKPETIDDFIELIDPQREIQGIARAEGDSQFKVILTPTEWTIQETLAHEVGHVVGEIYSGLPRNDISENYAITWQDAFNSYNK